MEDCLSLLGGKTDEEKFAGLLLVARLSTQENAVPIDSLTLTKVYQAVGPQFFPRLLHSSGEKAVLYHNLAVNVLSVLFSDEELPSAEPSILDSVPHVLDLLTDTPERKFAVEVLDCLSRIVTTPAGNRAVLVGGVIETCAAFALAVGDAEEEVGRAALGLALRCLRRGNDRGCSRNAAHDVALACDEALPNLASYFFHSQQKGKFVALDLLLESLSAVVEVTTVQPSTMQTAWADHAKLGITAILSSRPLTNALRTPALALCRLLMDISGPRWLASACSLSADLPTFPSREAALEPAQFTELLIQVCRVEVRMLLEQEEGAAIPDEDKATIAVCFGVLEGCIEMMVTLGEDLTADSVFRMGEALRETFSTVIDYLAVTRVSSPNCPPDGLPHAALRALGGWLAEESEAFLPQLTDLLPWMLAGEESALFLMPWLACVTADDEFRRVFLQHGGYERAAAFIMTAIDKKSFSSLGSALEILLTIFCTESSAENRARVPAPAKLLHPVVDAIAGVCGEDNVSSFIRGSLLSVALLTVRMNEGQDDVSPALRERVLACALPWFVDCLSLTLDSPGYVMWERTCDIWCLSVNVYTDCVSPAPAHLEDIVALMGLFDTADEAAASLLKETEAAAAVERLLLLHHRKGDLSTKEHKKSLRRVAQKFSMQALEGAVK